MKEQHPKKQLNIWDDVLKKNVKSNLLQKARTVPQKDKPYEVQVFELLVAESLNLQDSHTNWEVTRAGHDSGVDLLGTDVMPCKTPFTATQYRLLSIGQVKRSKHSYKYEDFRIDIHKARGYWLNSNLFHGNSPKQFLFVLSTEGKNGVKVLQKHLENDLSQGSCSDIQLKNDQLAHVQLIDAAYIIKSWKFHLSYFEEILEDALSPEQLACFHEYVTELDNSWLSVSVESPQSGGVGELITYSLLVEVPTDTISLSVYVRWVPPDTGEVQLLHPLQMISPRVPGALLRIKGQAMLQMSFRSMKAGLCDFGCIELYSEEKALIHSIPLKSLELYEGICPVYFNPPNRTTLQSIKNYIFSLSPTFIPISISGCGGIGKSSLISEVMVTAAAEGYFSVDLMQPKDLLHPRFLLHRLFMQLLRPNMPQNALLPDILFQVKVYLGSSFLPNWEPELEKFFGQSSQEIDTEAVVQCLVSLLFVAAQESNIFLWMSNMHWASKETLDILRMVLDALDANQELLVNRILWIFEGRSGEVLSYNQRVYYPVYWERFLTNNLLRPYALPSWKREDSLNFLKQMFMDVDENRILYNDYLERLLDCSGGVPMQMLELIRIHLDQEILYLEPTSHRLRLQRILPGNIGWPESITETIDRRIHFYRKKCSDFIDFCVVLAALDDAIPPLLAGRLMRRLHTEHVGIDTLVFRSGFLTQAGQEYHFHHEHYQNVFQMQQILNRSLLAECLAFYKRLPAKEHRDHYAEIKLRLLDEETDLAQLRRDIISLLDANVPKPMEQSLYKLLLQIPPHTDGSDIPLYKILFLLCESYLREGSWQAGADCLKQLLSLPRSKDIEELLIHIKAYQETANILADQLFFEQAVQAAESGLELAELCLESCGGTISHSQYAQLCVQREKLLARLAVCHWFAGDVSRGLTLQRQCYDLAVARKDSYSAGHVLYEIGTLAFHFNLKAGLAIMEAVLRQCSEIPSLERHERTLIETQCLMGRLLLGAAEENTALLKKVMVECRRLLELNRTSPHSYERFLCLTMRGTCAFLLEHDIKKAQDSFFESLRCAEESDMPNLKWKALFHIAQICALDENAEPEIYAKEAKSLIETAIDSNQSLRKGLEKMFQPVQEQLSRLIKQKNLAGGPPSEKTMISVSAGDCLFVIMN